MWCPDEAQLERGEGNAPFNLEWVIFNRSHIGDPDKTNCVLYFIGNFWKYGLDWFDFGGKIPCADTWPICRWLWGAGRGRKSRRLAINPSPRRAMMQVSRTCICYGMSIAFDSDARLWRATGTFYYLLSESKCAIVRTEMFLCSTEICQYVPDLQCYQ